MKVVKINMESIKTWDDFHDEFFKKFNFPDYYGRNMDAWIDCMDDIEELTTLDLGDCKESNLEIINAILECSAFVNARKIEEDLEPTLIVSMF